MKSSDEVAAIKAEAALKASQNDTTAFEKTNELTLEKLGLGLDLRPKDNSESSAGKTTDAASMDDVE